ncbi:hypothetical protein [Desulfitibacter alkalitolerans]|uniref:hypothetical protein n=1 Tax=Desulfitibacter alkalitolerans TaxID=264641 RepID=UPI000486CBA8|nr:hypothetical protein [Desulfitibacter alkalitolerans]
MINEKHSINSCVSHCRGTLSDIQQLAQAAHDQRAKDELNKALYSMDVCIKQCEAALQNANNY